VWGWGAMCDPSTKRNAQLWFKATIGSMTTLDGGYYDPTSDAMVFYDKNEYCINEEIVGIKSRTPIILPGLHDITAISAGYGHALALDRSGSVWSFGCNTFGQLGRETANSNANTTPSRITGLSGIKAVSAGYRHSLALDAGGNVWGWGLNNHGQLGTRTSEIAVSPIRIGKDEVDSIIAGYDYSLAVTSDRSLWGWGHNRQLWFDGNHPEYVPAPVRMDRLSPVSQLAAGAGHMAFIQAGPAL
jgi:alpha-tubulin suppressor-like RCC1 family protein